MAAVIVYLSHIRLFLYPQFRDLAARGILIDAFYLVTKLGHVSVIVFFVLSGYLVGGSVLKDFFSGRWRWDTYLIKRSTRLYIVLVPALLLTLFWDSATAHLSTNLAATASDAPVASTLIASRFGASTFLCNLLFLQTIFSPPYGSDVALWSLSWEWWYYILFPCCLMAMKSSRRSTYALLTLALLLLLGWHITLYFSIWLMGAGIGLWPRRWRERLSAPLLGLATIGVLLCAGFVQARTTSEILSIAGDFAVGVVTTLLIAALVDSRTPVPKLYEQLSHRLAAVSYTLYAAHIPFLLFLRTALLKNPLTPDLRSVPALLFIFTLGLGYAFALWWMAESRTDQIRRAIVGPLGVNIAHPGIRAA